MLSSAAASAESPERPYTHFSGQRLYRELNQVENFESPLKVFNDWYTFTKTS